MKINFAKGKMIKRVGVALTMLSVFFVGTALAQDAGGSPTIGTLATNVTQSFSALGQLILAISMVAGLGFTMAAIFKFKQHKDNPQQIPLGTPIAMLAIGVVLIFLPGIIKPAGTTIFGGSATTASGGLTGSAGLSTLPGGQGGGQ